MIFGRDLNSLHEIKSYGVSLRLREHIYRILWVINKALCIYVDYNAARRELL